LNAIRIHQHGGSDQLRYEDTPEPKITSLGEVIVKLNSAALNHIDIWTRLGVTGMAIPMPHTLGADGAGIVVEVGNDVKGVSTGDKVCLYPFTGCGECEFCLTRRDFMCIHRKSLGERLDGTYADYVKLPAENCFAVPAGFTFAEAAAFPLVFITLWRMLITNAQLKPGESLLIIGVGGGVASASLQVAKKIGAHVIVTSGADEKLEQAMQLGADHGINHRTQNFVDQINTLTDHHGIDVVLDCVAGETWRKSLAVLARGGRLVTCGATAGGQPIDDLSAICLKHLKIYGSTLGSREEFRQVLSFLQGSGIRPIIDRQFPLEDAAVAQERMERAQQFGKIVLQISV
jgi:NADPH:quinone reductase-like Zn-dependent oxidoreductase